MIACAGKQSQKDRRDSRWGSIAGIEGWLEVEGSNCTEAIFDGGELSLVDRCNHKWRRARASGVD